MMRSAYNPRDSEAQASDFFLLLVPYDAHSSTVFRVAAGLTQRHLHACPWEQVHWSNLLCAKDSQSEDSWHKVREKGAMAFCKVQVFWITKIWNIILNKIIKINPVTTEKCTLAVLDNKITKHVWIMRDLRWLNARSNAHWPVRLSFVCRSSRLQCLFPS